MQKFCHHRVQVTRRAFHNGSKQSLAYLDHLIPAAGHDDGVAAVGGETHAGHPLRVALVL